LGRFSLLHPDVWKKRRRFVLVIRQNKIPSEPKRFVISSIFLELQTQVGNPKRIAGRYSSHSHFLNEDSCALYFQETTPE
jgi:hypothetical protein